MVYLDSLFDYQIAVVGGQRNEKHTVDYLGFVVTATKDANEIFAILRLDHYHFMVEPALNRGLPPPRLLPIRCQPADTVDDLLRFVQTTIDQVVFTISARGMILPGFDV